MQKSELPPISGAASDYGFLHVDLFPLVVVQFTQESVFQDDTVRK